MQGIKWVCGRPDGHVAGWEDMCKSGGELADLMDKWLVWWTCSVSLNIWLILWTCSGSAGCLAGSGEHVTCQVRIWLMCWESEEHVAGLVDMQAIW